MTIHSSTLQVYYIPQHAFCSQTFKIQATVYSLWYPRKSSLLNREPVEQKVTWLGIPPSFSHTVL